MRKFILGATLLAFIFTLGVMTVPAEARPVTCDVKCKPSTPDNIVCTCSSWGWPAVVTCGDFRSGSCDLLVTGAESASLTLESRWSPAPADGDTSSEEALGEARSVAAEAPPVSSSAD